MAQWYVKELSKLTGVSVRTLHHYDEIGLLEPSVRLDNGYRLYSEEDLKKLQQIVALKFFGFKLSQIRDLLSEEICMRDHLTAQVCFLEDKAGSLMHAAETIRGLMNQCEKNKYIPWETVIKSMEVYRMTKEFEQSWVGQILTPEQIREYASFRVELKSRFTPEEKADFDRRWAAITDEIRAALDKDPESELAMNLASRWLSMVHGLYGKKHAALKNIIWEKGFKKGVIDPRLHLTPEMIAWMDRVAYAYYSKCIHSILDQVGQHNPAELEKRWNDLVGHICGEDQNARQEIINRILSSDKCSDEVKTWLRKIASRKSN